MTAARCREDRQDSRSEIKTSKFLIVEGNDDRNFFQALVRRLSIGDVGIEPYDGKDNLRSYLSGLVVRRGFEKVRSLGIVQDANGSAGSAFQRVQDCLDKENLPVPLAPAKRYEATDHETNGRKPPAISVFVLPDCENPGSLETLLYKTLDREIDQCITNFLKCAESVIGDEPKNETKARVFAYLATREKPRHSVGMAAKQGVWDFDHPAFCGLKDFVRGL